MLGKRASMSVFVPDLAILHDKYAYKYSVVDNRYLSPVSLVRILNKGGRYIFNLGLVNYFEMLILNTFLLVYSYKMETELVKEMQEEGKSDQLQTGGIPKSMSTPYILSHVSQPLGFTNHLPL